MVIQEWWGLNAQIRGVARRGECVEHRGQSGVEYAVENKDVDTHGNFDINLGNLADIAQVATGP
jgi:hypothetical protein